MEVVCRNFLILKELRYLFGPPARRTIDDGTAERIRRQVGHQNLMDIREFLSPSRRHHRKLQIIATGNRRQKPSVLHRSFFGNAV